MDCTTLLLLYFTSLSTTDIQTTVELLLGWSPQLTLEISTPRYLSRFSGLPVILYFAYAIWMEPYWITWILIMSCSWMLLFHQTVWITFYQLSSFCIKLQSSMMKAIVSFGLNPNHVNLLPANWQEILFIFRTEGFPISTNKWKYRCSSKQLERKQIRWPIFVC